MTDNLCFGICEHYQAELRAVLASDDLADVHARILPARCGHPPLTAAEVTACADAQASPCHTLHLFGGQCLRPAVATLSAQVQPRVRPDMRENCFALFVNASILEHEIRQGKYLMTPGWLARWQHHLETWGFDRPTARSFFGEWATQLLLLDTGVDPRAALHLQEFSDFLQIPGSTLPVGLDVFRLTVAHVVQTWRLEQHQQHTAAELSDASKQLADYAMLSHMLSHIAAINSEDAVIQRILELFTLLCAPQQALYLPIVQGEPGTLHGQGVNEPQIPDDLLSHLRLSAPYAWTASQTGFYLRIQHQAEVVGIIKIDQFTFPRYKNHYLNLAQNIATLCGLAVVNARRYQRLEIANADLRQAKEAADSANQAKSLFLSNMSHEFRTPLNGILGYAQLLLRDQSLSAHQREQIEILKRSGEHLLALIIDLLDIAKIEAHRIELTPTPFRFETFLKTLSDLIEVRAVYKRLRFIVDVIWPQLPEVILADEKRLRQILLNLLGNAVKFTETGAVTFRVRRVAEFRKVNAFAESDTFPMPQCRNAATQKLRFEVSDTGIGIPPDQLEAIFAPFEQVHHRRYYAEGTGLGLSISRRLVRVMGSELHVQSTPQQGSTFWFELELPEIAEAHMLMKPSDIDVRPDIIGMAGEPKTLLIVDHSREDRQFLKDALAPLGFEVLEAGDVRAAVDLACARIPDAICLDAMLPDLDGYAVSQHLLQMPALRDVVIVAISADASFNAREQALRAGCHDFLPKPVMIHDLLQSLQRHLRIDWVYAQDPAAQTQPAGQNPGCDLERVPLRPSLEALAVLYELSMIGDIFGIHDFLNTLERTEPQYAAFIATIRDLAKSFHIAKIQEILHTALTPSAAPIQSDENAFFA